MSNPNDFVIENGVLKKYTGPGGDVVVPEGVTSIERFAFSDCSSLTSITLPESLTSIGGWAFSGCSSLTSVTLPEGVTSIGGSAFESCSSLTSITLPDSISTVGMSAFSGCNGIAIHISDSAANRPENFEINNGILMKYTGPGGNVVVPEGVTRIGDRAFSGCSSLTSITLPESITSIGEDAFVGCNGLADKFGFVIVKGVLYQFIGSAGNVVVPEGVEVIGREVFRGCSGLTGIAFPESLTSIGENAFHGCLGLSSIVLPEGVRSIKAGAFSGCSNITNLLLPEDSDIGEEAFLGCTGLADAEGFVYKNGILFDYVGRSAEIKVPDGIRIISGTNYHGFFEHIRTVKRVSLPDSLIEIHGRAFYGCDLEELRIPLAALNGGLFGQSGKTVILTVTRPGIAPVRVVASFRKEYWSQTWNYPQDYLLPLSEEAIPVYDKLVASGSYDGFSMNENGRIRAALWRLADSEFPVADEIRGVFADFLASKLSKAIKFAEEDKAPEYIRTLVSVGAINADNQKKASRALSKSAVPEIQAMADQLTAPSELPRHTQQEAGGIEPQFAAQIKKLNAAGILMKNGIEALPPVMRKDGSEAPVDYLRLILAEYCRQVRTQDCFPVPLADEAAELLDRASLNAALRTVYDGIANEKQQLAMLLPLFRYAEGPTIRELYPKNHNTKWKEQAANRALLLSNTREAMLYADKQGLLWKYAEMRGTNADTLRDTVLSEFGFDGDGCKTYDLGTQTVTARLQKDLSFLLELPGGKTAKSLPKKGADPDKYTAANKDFTEMKKSVKKILNSRGKVLFAEFLSGRERAASDWKDAYLKNPLLREAASLVVWAQGKQTFTLRDGAPLDSKEQPYAITGEPIRVAHPMEMTAEDTAAWQKYFTAHGLKQPFAQVWEPARKAEEIKEDRYKGCMIPYYRFTGQSKRGITVEDWDFHNEIAITLAGCDAAIERIDWGRHEINPDDRFEIHSFRFKKYTRQVNHIVGYLDRVTVWDRVRKDDLSVMDLMPGFTLAQITEFIAAAQEANATNVLAELLEYKNANFADFDPMDEFTLEW